MPAHGDPGPVEEFETCRSGEGFKPPRCKAREVGAPSLTTQIRSGSFQSVYEVQSELGRGKFAVVKQCRDISTGREFAAKIQRKRRKAVDCSKDILAEAAMLELTRHHPCFVGLVDVFETASEITLITDFAPGGELCSYLVTEGSVSEQETIRLLRQILGGLEYLHERSIVHMDIKPQNILLTAPLPGSDIKLCDLGLARYIDSSVSVREIIGTPDYVAPEVLSYEPLQTACDIWSVGVLAYVMLTGCSVFAGDTKQETFLNISQVKVDFPDELFRSISLSAQHFITALLVREPSERPTARECLQHAWLSLSPSPSVSNDCSSATSLLSTTSSSFSSLSSPTSLCSPSVGLLSSPAAVASVVEEPSQGASIVSSVTVVTSAVIMNLTEVTNNMTTDMIEGKPDVTMGATTGGMLEGVTTNATENITGVTAVTTAVTTSVTAGVTGVTMVGMSKVTEEVTTGVTAVTSSVTEATTSATEAISEMSCRNLEVTAEVKELSGDMGVVTSRERMMLVTVAESIGFVAAEAEESTENKNDLTLNGYCDDSSGMIVSQGGSEVILGGIGSCPSTLEKLRPASTSPPTDGHKPIKRYKLSLASSLPEQSYKATMLDASNMGLTSISSSDDDIRDDKGQSMKENVVPLRINQDDSVLVALASGAHERTRVRVSRAQSLRASFTQGGADRRGMVWSPPLPVKQYSRTSPARHRLVD